MQNLNKIKIFKNKKSKIQNLDIQDILETFEKFSKKILTTNNFLQNKYRGYGLPFIAQWCSKKNLKQILNSHFQSLDELNLKNSKKNNRFKILPKGLVVHWIAGNVPTLGFLSLILGILTKNKNIVRLPQFSKKILEDLLFEFKKINKTSREICKNVLILRYDKKLEKISKKLSEIADARVIWGSDDTCNNIRAYKTKLSCEDLIFSNKVSFIIVDKKTLKSKKRKIFEKISRDILVFDQKACASPHTIFLEKATNSEVENFCKHLSSTLKDLHKRYKFTRTSAQKKMEILNLRLRYSLNGKVFSKSNDFSSTVLFDKKEKLGPIIENGTIFVRRLPDRNKIDKIFPSNIQTLGITRNSKSLKPYFVELQKNGLARIKFVGQMTSFESVWDGINIPLKLTRLSVNI